MPIKRLTFGRTACNLCAPSRPDEGQARRRRGNLIERTSRFAPSRCQVMRGPVRPPEDGCGTCLAEGSHVPRRGRFPACPARLDGPSRHHRNAHMSLVESPVRDRQSVGSGQSVSVRVELGGTSLIKKKKKKNK